MPTLRKPNTPAVKGGNIWTPKPTQTLQPTPTRRHHKTAHIEDITSTITITIIFICSTLPLLAILLTPGK